MKTEKWICNDIAISGERLIESKTGKPIAEVYNNKNVNLIKSAPSLLEALEDFVDCMELYKGDMLPVVDHAAFWTFLEQAKQAIKASKQ